MSTRHTMRTEVEVKFRPTGMTDLENAFPTLEIEFRFVPDYPEQGPSYASGGEPAAAAEVDLIGATMIDGDGLGDAPQEQVNDWARDYLDSDAGYRAACRVAEDEQGGDPDAAPDA